MTVILTKNQTDFPDPGQADEVGLIAIGGNLSTPSLLNAYRKGIFPWYSDPDPICWYSPDPRFVLFPKDLKISHSMRKLLRKGLFRFSVDEAFREVIAHCRSVARKGDPGTWITSEMEAAYIRLFETGYAHSAETWLGDRLVGGLYGVQLGQVFFGESMFSLEANASKFALISLVEYLTKKGIQLIDCQVHSTHLESLGATLIPRKFFTRLVEKLTA